MNGSLGSYPACSFDMSHAKDGTEFNHYSKDGDRDALYGPSDSDWRKYSSINCRETLEEHMNF